jgi:hypothetical protein
MEIILQLFFSLHTQGLRGRIESSPVRFYFEGWEYLISPFLVTFLFSRTSGTLRHSLKTDFWENDKFILTKKN